MNSLSNTISKNEDMTRGNVYNHLAQMKSMIQKNDGIRKFSPKTTSCHDQQAPFASSEYSYISLTHPDHHITHISDGFIHMVARYSFTLSGITDSNIIDEDGLLKLFVGHKRSNQVFYQLWIRNRNRSTGYEQNQMIREGYAMAQTMGYDSCKGHKFTHSLYEDVSSYNQNVCGTYVNTSMLKDGQAHEVDIEYIIPVDDLAAFQAFDYYPNALLGDIELYFLVRDEGLVWCQIDPHVVFDTKTLLQDEDIKVKLPDVIQFDHKFQQIGNPARIITSYSVDGSSKIATLDCGRATLHCNSMTVMKMESCMSGFKVCDETLRQAAQLFSDPCYIPSQHLFFNTFPQKANEGGLETTLNAPFENVTDMMIMFPKRSNDITVFENPMIDNFYLKTLGVQYPDKPISTQGAKFLRYQLQAADLDGGIRCTKEFTDSYTMARNDSNGTRYKNCLSDGTDFVLHVQTERAGAGYVFDGICSDGKSEAIEIKFSPIYSGANDTYYNFDTSNADLHPPAPQVWFVSDTYWELSTKNGLIYHKKGVPPGALAIDCE